LFQRDAAETGRRAGNAERNAIIRGRYDQTKDYSRDDRIGGLDDTPLATKFVPGVSSECSPPAGNYRSRRGEARYGLPSRRDFCQQAICIDLHPFSRLVKRVIKVPPALPRALSRNKGHPYNGRQGGKGSDAPRELSFSRSLRFPRERAEWIRSKPGESSRAGNSLSFAFFLFTRQEKPHRPYRTIPALTRKPFRHPEMAKKMENQWRTKSVQVTFTIRGKTHDYHH